MPLVNEPLIIGSQAWFIREGTTLASPVGTASKTIKPAVTGNDAVWETLGDIESSSEAIEFEEKKVFTPNPGHLELRKRAITKLDRMLKFTVATHGPMAVELTKMTAALTTGSSTFTPMAAPIKRGWLRVQRRDEADNLIYTEVLWGTLSSEGETQFGDDFARVNFVFQQESNSLSGGTIP